jgi:hypothetical protein
MKLQGHSAAICQQLLYCNSIPVHIFIVIVSYCTQFLHFLYGFFSKRWTIKICMYFH